ncbi:MAG: POT family MFS transporter [Chthoniobacterales bacterium]|nr:POT family MFS transporter [Chthoniobacterales bacterium]
MAKHQYATKPPNISTMPPGVPYIIGNEAAERFSFYGMRSILIVYLVSYLHMADAEARGYFALFVAAVYFFPIGGAILAEGILGKYRTILYLSIVYCLGHFTLAFMDTAWAHSVGPGRVVWLGLMLIAIGSGGIKPCVSANVGDQFGESNKHLLSKVFGWFYFSINAGSFISTIACPFLLNDPRFGPRWAFGIPGVAMVIATIFFWAGRKKFVHIPPAGLGFVKQIFSREGLGSLGRLAIVYAFVAVFWSLWDQSSGGSWTLQAQKMDLHWFGLNLLPAQVQTANPIFILLFIPLVNYVIYPIIDRFFTLTPLRKIGIGLFLTALSYVVIWHIQQMIDGGATPSVNWQFLAYAVLTLGEAMVSITGLEFSYTQAPNKMKSAVMALWLLTVSMGNFFTAGVNYFIQNTDGTVKLNDQQYFLFFAVLMFAAAATFVVFAMFYRGKTYLQSQETADEHATEPVLAGGTPT